MKRIVRLQIRTGSNSIVACVAAMILVAGCATAPKQAQTDTHYFFPMPPDQPRLQFLTSVGSEADLHGGKTTFTSFITGEAPSKNPIIKPYGVALENGRFLICDTLLSAIDVWDLKKKQISYITPQGEGRMRMPVNVSIGSGGLRYVCDTKRGQVLIFDAKDKYLGAIGEKDEMTPADAVASGDKLYVADIKGHCVRAYNAQSKALLYSLPRDTKDEKAQLFTPTNLAVDSKGRVLVSDTGGFRVQMYDAEGNFVRSIGQQGTGLGEFALPKGVAVDREGNVYVVDAATQVIQVFNEQGQLLMYFGEPDESPVGLSLPAKVIINYDDADLFKKYVAPGYKLDYIVIVTNQYGNRKVSVFGFIQKG